MKAIVQDRYGSADVLEFRDIEEPVVGDDDVLVRVRAAGCGPDVWHVMAGMPYMARLMIGLRKPKVAVRGWDVAGTVEAVGGERHPLRARRRGDGHRRAGLVRRARRARPRTSSSRSRRTLSFEQAAAAPDLGRHRPAGRARRGKGAGRPDACWSSARRAAWARSPCRSPRGSARRSPACAAPRRSDLVRSIGADDVIDYTREDFADGSRRWDLIVDTAGRRPLSKLRRALTPEGDARDRGRRRRRTLDRRLLPRRAPGAHGVAVRGAAAARAGHRRIEQEDLVTLTRARRGRARSTPVIDRTYPLIEAPDAIRYLAEGHAAGKIVITV